MLLTAIFHILSKNEPYNPELYQNFDVSPIDYEQKAIILLEKRGFAVSKVAVE
jgi:hypothetical protein